MSKTITVERPALFWHRAGGPPVEYGIWPERPVTIGRENTNTVVIESPFVSKAHAILQYREGQYVLEDLGSSNGTRVNGQPIDQVSLQPGDVVEFGDQRLEFVDRSTPDPDEQKGLSKGTKLLLVAAGSGGVMIIGLTLLLRALAPADAGPQGAGTRRTAPPPVAAALPSVTTPSGIVEEVVQRAGRAGVRPAEALFDEALVQFKVGRLRESRELLAAVVAQEPSHELAANRLRAVEGLLSQAIATYGSAGERAFAQLRYQDAVAAWEQVLLLAEPGDPRYRAAQQGISSASARISR